MLLDKLTDFAHAVWRETMLHSQFNLRLQPELRVPILPFDMDMHAPFFKGEEIEPKPLRSEHRWTHGE